MWWRRTARSSKCSLLSTWVAGPSPVCTRDVKRADYIDFIFCLFLFPFWFLFKLLLMNYWPLGLINLWKFGVSWGRYKSLKTTYRALTPNRSFSLANKIKNMKKGMQREISKSRSTLFAVLCLLKQNQKGKWSNISVTFVFILT